MKRLLWEYRQSLRLARQMKKRLEAIDKPTPRDNEDLEIVNGMISDLLFNIQWMTTGRNPNSHRGVDKHGVYLTDPSILEVLPVQETYKEMALELDEFQKELIEDALCTLTAVERDAFMMVRVELLSFEYAAELRGVKKSTIQKHVERAEKKIESRKNQSLFLVS